MGAARHGRVSLSFDQRTSHAHEDRHPEHVFNRRSQAGNRATSRLASMRYPHADRIRGAFGVGLPFRAVHDPAGCAERGTKAFTVGVDTHFADSQPDLHVSTHEAVHQLQHAGLTNDAGLGPEGQACAAADLARAGASARSLIGRRGRPVPAAERNYVYADKTGRWKDIEGGAALGLLGESGETLTFHSHDAYASPGLIAGAATILKAKQSGLEISDGGPAMQVEAPDGSGLKSLSRLVVKQVADPGSKLFYGDCGRLARDVMGPGQADAPASVVCSPGGTPRVIEPDLTKSAAKEHLALLLFIDRRLRASPNFATMTDEEKKTIADEATKEYRALSDTEKDKFIKRELAEGRIPHGKAEELGIDEYAKPEVGEAFTIVRRGPHAPNEFPYHWAAVIIVDGGNRVTFENQAVSGDPEGKNTNWYITTYGPASKEGQTYHEQWKGAFGADPHTLTARTQPPPPANVGEYPGKSTADLLAMYDGAAPNEQYYLKLELDRRTVSGTVRVVVKEDYFGNDEVILVFGRAYSNKVAIPEGSSGVLQVRAGALVPTGTAITVTVLEYDLFDPNDVIGTIPWPAPFGTLTTTVTGDEATYVVTLKM